MSKVVESFFQWLVTSSSDPMATSMSIRGIFLLFIPGLIYFLNMMGVPTEESVFIQLVNFFTGVLGIILLAIGLVRKLLYGQKPPVQPDTKT